MANVQKIDNALCSIPGIPDFAPGGFLVRAMGFVGEHPRLGPAALLALLPAYLLDSGYLRRHLPGLKLFNFVEQYPPGNEPIESLLTSGLALDLQASRSVQQHDARRRFIDILTSMSSGSHKSFLNIELANPQGCHPLGKLLRLFWVHWKRGHRRSVFEQAGNLNRLVCKRISIRLTLLPLSSNHARCHSTGEPGQRHDRWRH